MSLSKPVISALPPTPPPLSWSVLRTPSVVTGANATRSVSMEVVPLSKTVSDAVDMEQTLPTKAALRHRVVLT
jgi:hypothetical protein